MTRYYCPYCHPRYQFHKKRNDGVLICGQCGDPLLKIPLIKPTQIFALIAAAAFISPFIAIALGLFQEQNQPKQQKFQLTLGITQKRAKVFSSDLKFSTTMSAFSTN